MDQIMLFTALKDIIPTFYIRCTAKWIKACQKSKMKCKENFFVSNLRKNRKFHSNGNLLAIAIED
jgi:hypothetical protein